MDGENVTHYPSEIAVCGLPVSGTLKAQAQQLRTQERRLTAAEKRLAAVEKRLAELLAAPPEDATKTTPDAPTP